MKNYIGLTIIFALIILLGSIPISEGWAPRRHLSSRIRNHTISEGFYGPTNSFMNNKLEVMQHLSARIRNHTIDQEVNNHYQRSTRRPKTIKIFVPRNNNRFDTWGG